MADTNSDLRQLAVSGIRRFNALASAVPGCVKLTLGEPEFDTPAPVKEAVSRSLAEGQTHYPPNNGKKELREAISAYMREQGLDYGAEDIIVACGATEALSEPRVSFMMPLHRLSTTEVRRKPAATTNMVAISRVFTFEKPASAPFASMQPVKYSAAREIIAVSHMGILFSI